MPPPVAAAAAGPMGLGIAAAPSLTRSSSHGSNASEEVVLSRGLDLSFLNLK